MVVKKKTVSLILVTTSTSVEVCYTPVNLSMFCCFNQVISIEEKEVEVSFLRKKGAVFVFPDIVDSSWHTKDEISVLPPPKKLRRDRYDFSYLNI